MHPQAMLSVCTQHCGTALGQATAQTTHSVLHEEREYTVLQELGPPHVSLQSTHPALEGSLERQPQPPVGLGGSQCAPEAKP